MSLQYDLVSAVAGCLEWLLMGLSTAVLPECRVGSGLNFGKLDTVSVTFSC